MTLGSQICDVSFADQLLVDGGLGLKIIGIDGFDDGEIGILNPSFSCPFVPV